MSINLNIRLSHPSATQAMIRFARVDNTSNPTYVTVVPNVNVTPVPTTIDPIPPQMSNVPNGQYEIQATPIYADGRTCSPIIYYTEECEGLTSINAYISATNIIVEWQAPSYIPKARLSVAFPSGGTSVANYTNMGGMNSTVIPIPPGNSGLISVQGQSVCDEGSGFYSTFSSTITLNNNGGVNPIPSIYKRGNNIDTLCNGSDITLYTNGAFGIGSVVYQDSALTIPVTGYTYISNIYSLIIYALSTTTGEVLSTTGQSCNVQIHNNFLTDNYKINTVTGITGFSLPGGGVLVNTSYTGTRTPAGTFTISVNVSANVTPSGRLSLLKNSIEEACLNVSANTTYNFPAETYAANDLLEIVFEPGSC